VIGAEACGASGVVLAKGVGAGGLEEDAAGLGTLADPNVEAGVLDPKTLGASLTAAKGDADEAYAMKPVCYEID
jgi:hypothetical protein